MSPSIGPLAALVAAQGEAAAAYITVTVADARELASRGGEFPVCGDFAERIRRVVDR